MIEDKKFSTVNHITVSVGVTLVNSEEAPASLLKRADQAVYEAKESGRNKVVMH
ncbi:diguanylate cyclase [uncultured Succinivibrio sp.]|uniref:diguanylate cyclase n=1 Tax=uncultured Succinivibrio sp. TaxID=540749 RepID=UPI003440F8AB